MKETIPSPSRWRPIARAVAKSLLVWVLVAVSSAAIWPHSPRLASLWMMVGSAGLMLRTFGKPWPLKWYSLLVPLVMIGFSYALQVAIVLVPPLDVKLSVACGAGGILGLLRAVSHKLSRRGGQVVAHRTILVLAVWLACYLVSQSASLFGTRRLVEWGLSGAAFGTMTAGVFYLVMWFRYLRWRTVPAADTARAPASGQAAAIVLAFAGVLAGAAMTLRAQDGPTPQGAAPVARFETLRYGKTTYKAALNPAIVEVLDAAKRAKWVATPNQSSTTTTGMKELEGWEFRAGSLVVDWDHATATMEPLLVSVTHLDGEVDKKTGAFTRIIRNMSSEGINPDMPYLVGQGHGDAVSLSGVASMPHTTWIVLVDPKTGKPYPKSDPPNTSTTRNLIHGISTQKGEVLGLHMVMPYDGMGYKMPTDWQVLFTPVQSTGGTEPTAPSLHEEKRGDAAGWVTGGPFRGSTLLVGKLADVHTSPYDSVLAARFAEDIRVRQANQWTFLGPGSWLATESIQARIYKPDGMGKAYGRAAEPAQLEIDWDRRTAELKGVAITTHQDYAAHPPVLRLAEAEEALEQFKPVAVGRVKFDYDGALYITDGLEEYSVISRRLREAAPAEPGKKPTWKEIRRTDDVPLKFRNKAVQVGWEAVALSGGRVKVRLYAHPSALWGNVPLPAWYEFAFDYKSGTVLAAAAGQTPVVARPTPPTPPTPPAETPAPPPEPAATGQEPTGTDTASRGEGAGALTSPFSGLPWWDPNRPDLLNDLVSPGDLASEAAAAGALIALLWMLFGGLSTTATAAADAAAGDAGDGAGILADFQKPLIDPRDGKPFDTDGDKVWWGGKDGWVDKDTARQWCDDILGEQAARDAQVNGEWNQWMAQKDADSADRDQALLDAGYSWNKDAQAFLPAGYAYDPEHDVVVPPDGTWDPHEGRYVTPNNIGGSPITPDLKNVYTMLDYIDDHISQLPPQIQQSVLGDYGQLKRINLSDPYNISPADYDRLYRTAMSVKSMVTGQDLRAWADAENLAIDHEVVSGTIKNLGIMVARAAATIVDPTKGVLTGAVFGYLTAPDGKGLQYAAIGGACGLADVVTAGVNPGSYTWQVGSGFAVGSAEQALYGGDMDDILRGGFFNGAMRGVTTLAHAPGTRAFLDKTDQALGARLGIEPHLPGRPGVTAATAGIGEAAPGRPGVHEPATTRTGSFEPVAGRSALPQGPAGEGSTPSIRPPSEAASSRLPAEADIATKTGAFELVAGRVSPRQAPVSEGPSVSARPPSEPASSRLPGETVITTPRTPAANEPAVVGARDGSPAPGGAPPTPPAAAAVYAQTNITPPSKLPAQASPAGAAAGEAAGATNITVPAKPAGPPGPAAAAEARPAAGSEPAPTTGPYDPVESFQKATGVKIDGPPVARPRFDELDLMQYAKNKYPRLEPQAAIDQARADLTYQYADHCRRAEYAQDEASFLANPNYDPSARMEMNHGVNNAVRDQYAFWVKEPNVVRPMAADGDPGFQGYVPGDMDPRTWQELRRDLDLETGGRTSQTFPDGHGLDWNEAQNPNLPKTKMQWIQRDRDLGLNRGSPVGFDARTPDVQAIIDAHPEIPQLGEFDQAIRDVAKKVGYSHDLQGQSAWDRFQEELPKAIDLSTPKNRELMARWTYYVLERQTGTPPWIRTPGS